METTLKATLVVLVLLVELFVSQCADVNESREEVIFYENSQFEGDRLFITLAPGCYNFESSWNNRISSVDTQGFCIIAWDHEDCRGPSVKLAPGVRGLSSLRQLDFDNVISSMSVCSGESAPRHREDDRNRLDRIKNSQGQRQHEDEREVWKVAIHEHNRYRKMHGVPDLLGDPDIHQAAQKHADYLAMNNKFETSQGTSYGENLATSYKPGKPEAIREVVKRWYDKIEYYDFRRPESNKDIPKSGQFSSIVWKSTKYMGVGVAWNDQEQKWIIVCFYDPSATRSHYEDNVSPPISGRR